MCCPQVPRRQVKITSSYTTACFVFANKSSKPCRVSFGLKGYVSFSKRACIKVVIVVRPLFGRPVFDEERRRCTAWSAGLEEGGISRAQEAEREEMARIRESKRAAEERQYLAFEQVSELNFETIHKQSFRYMVLYQKHTKTCCRHHSPLLCCRADRQCISEQPRGSAAFSTEN